MKKNISTTTSMFRFFTILIVLCFFRLNAADESAVNKKDGYMGVGLGMGIPYGVIGINFEFNPHLPAAVNREIHNYFSVSIGLGLSPGGTAYSVGIRFYPIGREKFYQPLGEFKVNIFKKVLPIAYCRIWPVL